MNGNSIGQNIYNIHDGSKIKWAKDVIWSRIKTNNRVTAPNWFQDVRSLELEFDSIPPSYVYSLSFLDVGLVKKLIFGVE